MTFHQKADECGLKPWNIQTFENVKQLSNVVVSGSLSFLTYLNSMQVTLDGIDRVSYEVGDDLKAIPKDRHGAICKGDASVYPRLA